MRYLYFLSFFLIFIIAVLFSIKNFQPVLLNFYYIQFELPLALVLTLELLAGVVLGLIAGFFRSYKLKAKNEQLHKQLLLAERELEELHTLKSAEQQD